MIAICISIRDGHVSDGSDGASDVHVHHVYERKVKPLKECVCAGITFHHISRTRDRSEKVTEMCVCVCVCVCVCQRRLSLFTCSQMLASADD